MKTIRRFISNIMYFLTSKKIIFTFINPKSAHDSNEDCCCTCAYRLQVNKHCLHNLSQSTCICDQPLGFYICAGNINWKSRRVNISGEHGECEIYINVKDFKEDC